MGLGMSEMSTIFRLVQPRACQDQQQRVGITNQMRRKSKYFEDTPLFQDGLEDCANIYYGELNMVPSKHSKVALGRELEDHICQVTIVQRPNSPRYK